MELVVNGWRTTLFISVSLINEKNILMLSLELMPTP